MGTRSLIGYETETGDIIASYCHWDGYLEGVGLTLSSHYNDENKAKAVSRIGYASALHETLEETICDAANIEKPSFFKNAAEYVGEEDFGYCGTEFLYLWRDGQWFWTTPNDQTFKPIDGPATKLRAILGEVFYIARSTGNMAEIIELCERGLNDT